MHLKLDYTIPTKNLLTIVISIPVFLFFIDSVVYSNNLAIHRKIAVLFNITLEANIPTWYSSLVALATGLAGLLIVEHYAKLKQRFKTTIWLLIALFFIYMSMDDTSQFHERVATVWAIYAKSTTHPTAASIIHGFESYYWQLLFLPVFAAIGLAMLYVIKTEFKVKQAQWFFILGLSCFVFAVALDYIDGIDSYYEYVIQKTGVNFQWLEHFSRAVEEMTEMIGLGFILTALLLHREHLLSSLSSDDK